MLSHDLLAQAATTPIVLVHGFPLDRRVFEEVARLLSTSHTVVNVDLPGSGQSLPFEGENPSIDDFAKALHSTLSAKKLLPCHLAGLSMGGYVALAFHRRFAHELKSVILVDSKSAADTTEAKEGRNKMADLARREGSVAVAKQMLPKMVSPEATAETRQQLVELMNACPPATIVTALIAMRDRPDYTSDLAMMAIPLLVLTGQHDSITPPEGGRAAAKAAPMGTFVEIAEAGHLSPLEQPAAVAAAMRKFVSR